MTEQREWVPSGVDTSVPSVARAYDYLLGGGHHFAADRQLAERAEQAIPGSADIARLNRAFLGRAVRFLVESGVRQFLDIGSGIPTVGNVHEIAQQAAPECRVLYVDKDLIAVSHSELLLAGNEQTGVLRADLRDPEAILGSDEAARLLDFEQPIGLLMVMMLHWVSDEDEPYRLVARYRDALPPGSHLAISHMTADQRRDQVTKVAEVVRQAKTPDQLSHRSHAEIVRFFDGFEIVEPGVVGCGLWRPGGPGDVADIPDVNAHVYAGVGRLPA